MQESLKGCVPMVLTKSAKAYYSESEAAEALGVSVEQLRSLIRNHIVVEEEDVSKIPVATFQPSDLLVLRLLAGLKPDPTTPR